MLRPTAAKTSGYWHRGIADTADHFMKTRHRGEAENSRQRFSQWRTQRAATKGNRGGSRTDIIAEDECRNEMVDRVARYQFD